MASRIDTVARNPVTTTADLNGNDLSAMRRFAKQAKKGSTVNEDFASYEQIEQHEADQFASQVLDLSGDSALNKSHVSTVTTRSTNKEDYEVILNNEQLNEFVADYIAENDCDMLFEMAELHKTKLNKGRLNELVSQLDNAGELPEVLLDEFIKSGNFNVGEIYIILTYLFEEFRKKRKQKLASLLSHLLRDLQQQESAYLCEFFDLAKNASNKAGFAQADALAKVNSGKVSLQGVKQVVKFIKENLNDEYDDLILTCIKRRSKILRKLSTPNLSFEDKTELSDYMEFEKYIIMTYSIYSRMRLIMKALCKGALQLKVIDNNNACMSGLLGFNESVLVSETALTSLLRNFGIIGLKKADLIIVTGILLIHVAKMPYSAFSNDKQRQIITDGLRLLQRKLAEVVESEAMSKQRFSSFINPKKRVVNNV